MRSRTLLWTAAAVLGIVATATVAWAASQLATPNIGLSSEPPSVVSGLAPASTSTPAHPRGHAAVTQHLKPRAHPTPHVATTPPGATAPPAVTVPSAPAPAPLTHAPAAPSATAAPATTITQSPQPASPAPQHRQTTHHRDDSRGDGSGGSGSRSGRDD